LKTLYTVDLRLPNGVGHAPEGGHQVEDRHLVGVAGGPIEEEDDHADVDQCAHDEDGHAAHLLDDEAEAEGAEGIAHAVDDQHVADDVHSVGAGNVTLKEVNCDEWKRGLQRLSLTAVKSAPKKPCSTPDQKVSGMM